MESITPPALEVYRSLHDFSEQDAADWVVRIVPNKYPALSANDRPPLFTGNAHRGAYLVSGATGIQEVIVISPRHVSSLSEVNDFELQTAFLAFQRRLKRSFLDASLRHSSLFMNCRPAAGASIEHIHFQLISSAICTDQVAARFKSIKTSVNEDGFEGQVTTLHLMTNWEQQQQTRILESSDRFTVFCPFASRMAFQIWIVPHHSGHFSALDAGQRWKLARLCRRWITRLESVLDCPAYNLIFHLPPHELASQTDPRQEEAAELPFHSGPWFIEILPRTYQIAGFEIASECWINSTSPESAAAAMREAT